MAVERDGGGSILYGFALSELIHSYMHLVSIYSVATVLGTGDTKTVSLVQWSC